MIRSPSGDMYIIALIILHEFDRITILSNNGVGKKIKIIDMLTSLFGLRLATLLKKRLWLRCFTVNFVKF